jgi:penicillin-binding protein 1A
MGYEPNTIVVDDPISINGWSPRNSTRSYSGSVTVREAFARSINTISAELGQAVGFRAVADMAQRFGITTEVNTHPSMVLGTSDVRLIDMTRAFAAVARKGVAVTPYGIRRVTTAESDDLLFQHESDESRVLVAPWVAAQMTDLLQAAVMTGTGRAAQIGRPVAGKTGTTSANKDGWFIGFSSGLTTGVWMGRDDARAVGGLQGGRAPAAAFHDFMVKAVQKRPIEKFEIEVALPNWQVEPDDEAWYGEDPSQDYMLVDPDGNPIADPNAPGMQPLPENSDPYGVPPVPPPPGDERLNQEWLDRAINRERAPVPRDMPPPRRREPMPPPGSREPSEAADPVEGRPFTS